VAVLCIAKCRPGAGSVAPCGTKGLPVGLQQAVCGAGMARPALQTGKLRPRKVWQGWAWLGKRKRGCVGLLPRLASQNKHL